MPTATDFTARTVAIDGREVEAPANVESVSFDGTQYTIEWRSDTCATLDEVIEAGGLVEVSR